LSSDDRRMLDRYSNSVWQKGDFETRALVDHIVTSLGDQPISIIHPKPEALPRAKPKKSVTKDTYTVVIVDDNIRDARLARRLVESSGNCRVIEAHSGRDGLKAIHEHRPDLIILDLMLPDLDGITILEVLGEDLNLNAIPIIVYSAKELTTAENEQIQARIRTVIHKAEFSRQQFVSIVSDLLN
jgi:CheY-like chemotaxis protein